MKKILILLLLLSIMLTSKSYSQIADDGNNRYLNTKGYWEAAPLMNRIKFMPGKGCFFAPHGNKFIKKLDTCYGYMDSRYSILHMPSDLQGETNTNEMNAGWLPVVIPFSPAIIYSTGKTSYDWEYEWIRFFRGSSVLY